MTHRAIPSGDATLTWSRLVARILFRYPLARARRLSRDRRVPALVLGVVLLRRVRRLAEGERAGGGAGEGTRRRAACRRRGGRRSGGGGAEHAEPAHGAGPRDPKGARSDVRHRRPGAPGRRRVAAVEEDARP